MRTVRANIYWKVSGEILAQTEKAVRIQIKALQGVELPGARAIEWFPKSQIENITLGGDGEPDSFEATQWILGQKGYSHDLDRITKGLTPVTPQRTVVERFPEGSEEEYMPKESERRTLPSAGFDDFDDDIPF